jgi:hypothetical protein
VARLPLIPSSPSAIQDQLEKQPSSSSPPAAGMLQNIDKQVLRIRRIFGRPITDAFHVMPLEDCVSVIAKARFERVHFALFHVIQAQFVNVVRRLRIRSAKCAEAEHYRRAAKKRWKISCFHRCPFRCSISDRELADVMSLARS